MRQLPPYSTKANEATVGFTTAKGLPDSATKPPAASPEAASPFLGMGLCYDWRATEPGATLSVHIAGGGAFDATLALRRRPLSTRTLVAAPWRMLALIYGHGVALKLRGVPVHRHPAAA